MMNGKNTKTAKELYELGMSKLDLLNGTEAENKEALELLEEAANQGCEPAIQELRDIHHTDNDSQV